VRWAEGRNIRIDTRWATADVESIQRFAKELVALQPELVVSTSTPSTAWLLQQTRTIPIIFTNVSDPVGSGFVVSLRHPGGNATGFSTIEGSLGGKWLELLKQIAPHVSRVALMFNPVTASYVEYLSPSFKAAGTSFAVEATTVAVHDATALEAAIAAQAREPAGGMVIMNEDFTIAHRVEIVSLAARYRLPTVYPFRFFAELGGLSSYGVDLTDNFRRAAGYADRVLKGAVAGELPVQAPVKFELVINIKTAKELGLEVPLYLQQRADEVIE